MSKRPDGSLSLNIGTPSVQELFFCDRSISRTVYSIDLFKIYGCDVQQERNWEDSKHLVEQVVTIRRR